MEEMKSESDRKWEVDQAVDTLLRAEEIKGDKELMAMVEKKLAKKYKAIKSLQDLKDAASEMDEDEEDEDEGGD